MVYCELEPPVRDSVKQVTPQMWSIGTSVICHAIDQPDCYPSESFASWVDGAQTFHLIRRSINSPASSNGDSSMGRVYDAGSGCGVWFLGKEAVIKVKSWIPGQQSEAATIAFVRNNAPSIPLPSVICYWEDEASNRSFLVMHRAQGRTLDEAWHDLKAEHRVAIADEVASHIETLAAFSRPRYESVDGCGILDNWHMETPPQTTPSWKHDTLGPFSIQEMRTYMTSISIAKPPQLDDLFILFHADLNALNIIVQDDGEGIVAILDWESVGFFPSYWITTRCRNFRMENAQLLEEEQMEWREGLKSALIMRGFVDGEEQFMEWRNGLHDSMTSMQ